jgi:hypothetical protein
MRHLRSLMIARSRSSSAPVDPKPVQKVWYDKDTIAGMSQGMILAKVTPSANIRLTKIIKQVNSFPSYFSNTFLAIIKLEESNGLYSTSSYKFNKSNYSGLSLTDSGSMIDGKEVYDLACNFTSADINADNTLLLAGNTYGICLGDVFSTYYLLSGDTTCIGSMYGWQIQGSNSVSGMSVCSYTLSGTVEYTAA